MSVKKARKNPSSVCVLISGGVDSSVLLAELAKAGGVIFPVYIRCGLFWERAELFWLKKYLRALPPNLRKYLRPLTVLEVPVGDLQHGGWALTGRKTPGYHSRDEEVYLPGRNLLLLSKAATFCALRKIPSIAIGSLSGNPFPDATPKFFASFGRLATQALGQRIRIVAPFSKMKKKEVLKKGKGLPLHLSFSCLSPRKLKSCGWCNKCAEKEKVTGP